MAHSIRVTSILSQVQQLDSEEQLTLLQRIASLIKSNATQKKSTLSLATLSGLGSDVWKGKKEIDSYLESERQW